MVGTGDIDFSSLWSWTVPLWGLALLVLFLGGVITHTPIVMTATATPPQSGGVRRHKLL
jgi:hypothetical protein